MMVHPAKNHLLSSQSRTSSTNGTFIQIFPLLLSTIVHNKNNFHHMVQAIKVNRIRLEEREAQNRLVSQL